MFLKILQELQDYVCAKAYFLMKIQALSYNSIKKETPTWLFSYEVSEICMSTVFMGTTTKIGTTKIRNWKITDKTKV